MNRTIYNTDGEYSLCPIIEDDREYYVTLREQVSGPETLFLNPVCKDLMWDQVLTGETKYYSVINRAGEFCGCIELQHPASLMPEIGIELLAHKRNQGIAKKAIKLLVLKANEEHPVDSYLIRILSRNTHSQHVFEQMGAVSIEKRESMLEELMTELEEIAKGEDLSKVIRALADTMYKGEKKAEEHVLEYRLPPSVFYN